MFSWLAAGAFTLFLGCVLCHLIFRNLARGYAATVCACLIGIASGSFFTVLLSGWLMFVFNPRIAAVGPIYLTAEILGAILGCSAAVFLMRFIASGLPTRHNSN